MNKILHKILASFMAVMITVSGVPVNSFAMEETYENTEIRSVMTSDEETNDNNTNHLPLTDDETEYIDTADEVNIKTEEVEERGNSPPAYNLNINTVNAKSEILNEYNNDDGSIHYDVKITPNDDTTLKDVYLQDDDGSYYGYEDKNDIYSFDVFGNFEFHVEYEENIYKSYSESNNGNDEVGVSRVKLTNTDLYFTVVDDKDEPLKDIRFELRDKETGSVISTKKTDSEGYIEFNDLPVNKEYTLKQLDYPAPLQNDNEVWTIKIREDGRMDIYDSKNIWRFKGYKMSREDEIDKTVPDVIGYNYNFYVSTKYSKKSRPDEGTPWVYRAKSNEGHRFTFDMNVEYAKAGDTIKVNIDKYKFNQTKTGELIYKDKKMADIKVYKENNQNIAEYTFTDLIEDYQKASFTFSFNIDPDDVFIPQNGVTDVNLRADYIYTRDGKGTQSENLVDRHESIDVDYQNDDKMSDGTLRHYDVIREPTEMIYYGYFKPETIMENMTVHNVYGRGYTGSTPSKTDKMTLKSIKLYENSNMTQSGEVSLGNEVNFDYTVDDNNIDFTFPSNDKDYMVEMKFDMNNTKNTSFAIEQKIGNETFWMSAEYGESSVSQYLDGNLRVPTPLDFKIKNYRHGLRFPIEMYSKIENDYIYKGYEFEVYKNGELFETIVSQNERSFKTGFLTPGDYVIKLVKNPYGHKIPDNPNIEFTVNEEGKVVNMKVFGEDREYEEGYYQRLYFDKHLETDVTIKKIDFFTGKPVNGAEFKITGPFEYNKTIKSEDDTFVFKGLKYGRYIIYETVIPDGYNEPYEYAQTKFVIDGHGKISSSEFDGDIDNFEGNTLYIKNKPKVNTFKIFTRPNDGSSYSKITGAEFKLVRDGEFVKRFSSDSEFFKFENLYKGKYEIHLVKPPTGYKMPEKRKITFEVNKEGNILNTTVFGEDKGNERSVDLRFVLDKVLKVKTIDQDTGELTKNAIFKVNDIETTSNTGYYEIKGLVQGDNIIKVIKRPDGYTNEYSNSYFDEIRVKIDKEGNITEVKVQNKVVDYNDDYVEFKNVLRKVSIGLSKKDETTFTALNKAKFEFYKNGKLWKTETLGSKQFNDFTMGKYVLKEIKAPSGYALPDNPDITFEIDGEGNVKDFTVFGVKKDYDPRYYQSIYNEKLGANLVFERIEEKTGKGIKNLVFEIKKDNERLRIITSDTHIYDTGNLKDGKYEIKEKDSEVVITFEVVDKKITNLIVNGEEREVTDPLKVFSKPVMTELKVKTVDAYTGEVITGATFEIDDKVYTSEDGYYNLTDGLTNGHNYIYRTIPDGYVKPNYDKRIHVKKEDNKLNIFESFNDIEYDEDGNLIVYFTPKSTDVQIRSFDKRDENILPLGAEYDLYKNNKFVKHIELTQSYFLFNEFYEIEGLTKGDYQLTLTKTPVGYITPDDPDITFNIDKNALINNVKVFGEDYTVSNNRIDVEFEVKKGTVKFKHVNSLTGELITDSEFQIRDYGTNKVKKPVNKDGHFIQKDLEPDEYIITRIGDQEGYERQNTVGYFTVDELGNIVDITIHDENITDYKQGEELIIYSTPLTLKISFAKINRGTNPIDGAEFDLYRNDKFYKNLTSENYNYIVNLPFGKYKMIETKAPKGYVLPDDPNITFEVKKDMKIYDLKMFGKDEQKQLTFNGDYYHNGHIYITNEREPATIKFKKIDSETGKGLKGASFELRDDKGNLLKTVTSDNDIYVIEDLKEGAYELQETVAPEGYKLPKKNQAQKFSVNWYHEVFFFGDSYMYDNDYGEKNFYAFKNDPIKFNFNLIDNIDKENIPNAKFEVRDENNELITTITTKKKEQIQFQNLKKVSIQLHKLIHLTDIKYQVILIQLSRLIKMVI